MYGVPEICRNGMNQHSGKTLATRVAVTVTKEPSICPSPWWIAVEMMHIATNTISTQLHESYRYFFQPPQQSHNKILDTSQKKVNQHIKSR